MISVVIPLVLFFFFCLGVGLILSAWAVYFRDMFHLYGVLISLLNYATPIFYPAEIVPEKYAWIQQINPLYYFCKAFRDAVYSGIVPDGRLLSECALLAVAVMVIGVMTFRKKQNHFILYV